MCSQFHQYFEGNLNTNFLVLKSTNRKCECRKVAGITFESTKSLVLDQGSQTQIHRGTTFLRAIVLGKKGSASRNVEKYVIFSTKSDLFYSSMIKISNFDQTPFAGHNQLTVRVFETLVYTYVPRLHDVSSSFFLRFLCFYVKMVFERQQQ